MKAQLRNKSRRKWIVGGAALFAGIALLTTGFATWVIGQSILDKKENTDVTVQTTKTEAIFLEVKVNDHAINLDEKYDQSNGGIIFVENGKETDFKIGFEYIRVKVSESYWNTHSITGVKFSLAESTNENANALLKTKDFSHNFGRTAETEYTFLDINEDSTVTLPANDKILENKGSGENWIHANGFYTYTFVGKKEVFKWGTLFDGKSPCTYYNDPNKKQYFFEKDTDGNDILKTDGLYKANNEMTKMHDNFEGKKLTVKLTVTTGPKA